MPAGGAFVIRLVLLGLLVAAAALLAQPPDGVPTKPTPTRRDPMDARIKLNVAMGVPANASTDPKEREAFLILRPQWVASYNDSKRTPNWLCWHINQQSLPKDFRFRRQEFFNPDSLLPKSFTRVEHFDYHRDNGFDRGHLCPAADRSLSDEDNRTTFLTTNIVPQAPNNNQLAWERFERHCRELARRHEVFIAAGPHGRGGEGQFGPRTEIGRTRVQVPSHTWKVVLALPAGKTSPKDVTPQTTVVALITPNNQSVTEDWRRYEVSVADVERLTGYSFFSQVDPEVAKVLKAAGPGGRSDRAPPPAKSDGKSKPKKQAKELKGGLGK
jgi:endonuclease G